MNSFWKGVKLKTAITILTVVVLSALAGCDAGDKKPIKAKNDILAEGKQLLTVDFQEVQTLRYRFVSSRDIDIDWEAG